MNFDLFDLLIGICIIILVILVVWFLIRKCRQPSYKSQQCKCKESFTTSSGSSSANDSRFGFVHSWFKAITGLN